MVAFGAIALGVSSLIAVVCFVVTRNTLVAERETAAARQAFLNARAVRTALRLDDPSPTDAMARVQASPEGAALLRFDSEWYATAVGADRNDVPPSLLSVADGGSAARQRIDWAGTPTIVVAAPIAEADAIYVEFVPMTDVGATLARLRQALIVAATVTTVLGVVAGRVASVRLLRPVRRMADAANEIREGALDQRLEADGDADLEPLVDSFNSMVEGLQTRIEREARFASDVSHEMRSPLATMAAALSVTRRRVSDPAGLQALDALETEVDRFSTLVSDLLEISRAEAGVIDLHLEEVDPVEFARQVLASPDRPRERVDLVADCPPDTLVRLDKRRMAQSLTNLLVNADNYAGGPTALRVRATTTNVTFDVDDAGPGIPADEREYVFERFARGTTAEGAGTGLGLALVSEHVRLHGGTVQLSETPEGGARFSVILPRDTP
jgi:signal transduction histidine kinase